MRIIAPACTHCHGDQVELRRLPLSNGGCHIAWACLECNRWAKTTDIWLPQDDALRAYLSNRNMTIHDVPVMKKDGGSLQQQLV